MKEHIRHVWDDLTQKQLSRTIEKCSLCWNDGTFVECLMIVLYRNANISLRKIEFVELSVQEETDDKQEWL